MKAADIVGAFLAVCPTISSAWSEHLKSWGDEADRGHFNDAAVIAHHLVDSYERGELSEFPAAFVLLERCLTEGDDQARELATIGVIEGVQNIASYRSFGPDVFVRWLGPASRAAWDELMDCWGRIA